MLKNHLLVAVRNLRKRKGYAFINVLGLAVGIAGALLVGVFIRHQLSFDRFHEKADRIHRAWVEQVSRAGTRTVNTVTPFVMGPTLAETYPEVEAMTRYQAGNAVLQRGTETYAQTVAVVDEGFLDIFSFPVLKGDRATALSRPESIVLTDSASTRLFGEANPIGQTLRLHIRGGVREVEVTAVVGIPRASSLTFDALFTITGLGDLLSQNQRTNWYAFSATTFVLLREGVEADALAAKFPGMISTAVREVPEVTSFTAGLQGLLDIRLSPDFPQGGVPTQDPRTLLLLAIIAGLVVLIACINFTTLALGRSLERAREVGVRKALGALRVQLMGQFWGEAMLLTLLALVGGVALAALGMPLFSALAEQSLSLRFDLMTVALLLGITLIVALGAGAYPALALTRFQPTETLRGKLRLGTGGGVQRSLVAVQFALSTALVASTFVMTQQLHYLQEKNLGYATDRVVRLPNVVPGMDDLAALEPARAALEAVPAVGSVTAASLPFDAWGWAGFDDEQGQERSFRFNAVAPDFLDALDIKLAAGPGFAPEPTTAQRQAIVNQAFVEEYGLEDPVGQLLPRPFDHYVVAGVTEDFHFASLRERIEPAVLVTEVDSLFRRAGGIGIFQSPALDLIVRLGPGSLPEAMASLERAFKGVFPDRPFDYEFADDALDAQYRDEARLGRIVSVASGLAIFIAALGLFGLATLSAAQRTKEIGVRKVLGASVAGLVVLLTKDLAKLVLVGFVVAAPVAYYVMKNWLEGFAYRIELGVWVFLAAGVATLLIAIAATSWQAFKAAKSDPVKSLRYE